MTTIVEKMAPVILEAIKKADSILLHCHPSPDPDSVGSALAMKFVLESMGKKVTVMKGDSDIPRAFMHFPGAQTIVKKNFLEIDFKEFDLFIILDSTPQNLSVKGKVDFPDTLKVINIDHHKSNIGEGLIDATYPSTTQILFDLFKKWNVKLTYEIAANLFIGMYTDTGGFRNTGTTSETFKAAAELTSIAPDFPEIISKMDNFRRRQSLILQTIALSSLKTFYGDKLALTAVPYNEISKNSILPEDMSAVPIPTILISISEFWIGGSMTEQEPNMIKISFRSKDAKKYDVSKLAVALGGGGHKAAAGARLHMSLDEAVKKVVETAKIVYNL